MPLCARRAPRADGKTSTWAWHLDCWNPSSCAFSECEKWRETMAYQAEISRKNPGCFLFLIDQSESMEDPFGGGEDGRRKAEELATILNKLIHNLCIRCAKSDRKSTRLNSNHSQISYAVFCLKKKTETIFSSHTPDSSLLEPRDALDLPDASIKLSINPRDSHDTCDLSPDAVCDMPSSALEAPLIT